VQQIQREVEAMVGTWGPITRRSFPREDAARGNVSRGKDRRVIGPPLEAMRGMPTCHRKRIVCNAVEAI